MVKLSIYHLGQHLVGCPSTAGMSTRWDEWAGRSRIVIPLSGRAGMGVLGSVDTTPITDAPTVQSLKDESPTAVITSYSIHYTKLYDYRRGFYFQWINRFTIFKYSEIVITSYSIHYTKLYDVEIGVLNSCVMLLMKSFLISSRRF